MNTTRLIAQRNHDAALRALRIAEDGNDLAKWEAAEAAAAITRRALVEAEMLFPTTQEQRREARVLTLRNRGLDC
jgi:DNA-binding protein H-NS